MENLEPDIRNAVRALVVRDGSVLLLKKDGGGQGERYALPGGSQDTGETLIQTLDRECQEEIGTSVEIGELLYVADYFKPRDTMPASTRHLVEFLFSCNVPASYTPVNGHHPDKHQIEVVWMRLEELDQVTLLPKSVAGHLRGALAGREDGYLGLID
ncbi:MAG: NUDIX domain-containing protein [Gammaproteobacteria bacterium]|nr:NUDIX domain-containing protein [Gammaproteobacteria bacterium]